MGDAMFGLGITFGLLGSIAINAGNNLQSYGMSQLEEKLRGEAKLSEINEEGKAPDKDDEGALKNGPGSFKKTKEGTIADSDVSDVEIEPCQSKIWVVGTTIFVTGSLLNFTAFAFAPQSVLASLEGIQFVTNVLFGKLVLGKHITASMYAGTFVVIIGVVLTVASASVVGALEADFPYLLKLWAEPGWIVYLLMTGGFGVVLQATHQVYLKANAAGSPLAYSELVLPVTYATFSALFGTLSVVFAKILSEIVTMMLEGTPIFWGPYCWFTYLTLLAWLGLVGVWLYRMNEALSLYDPLFIIPLLQMNFILFAIISGGIYFKEFAMFKAINWAGFAGGVCLLFLGIFLLSPSTGGGDNVAVHPDPDPGLPSGQDEDSLDSGVPGPIAVVTVEPSADQVDGAGRGDDGGRRRSSNRTPPPGDRDRPPLGLGLGLSSMSMSSFREGGGGGSGAASPNHHHVLPYHAMIPPKMRATKRLTEESTLYRTLSIRLQTQTSGEQGSMDGDNHGARRPSTAMSVGVGTADAPPQRPMTAPPTSPPAAWSDLSKKLSVVTSESGGSEPNSPCLPEHLPDQPAKGSPVTP